MLSGVAWELIFAAAILFDASVCGIPANALTLKDPLCDLNKISDVVALYNTPEKPFACVTTAPSVNEAGIEGEPVKTTLNDKLGIWKPDCVKLCDSVAPSWTAFT